MLYIKRFILESVHYQFPSLHANNLLVHIISIIRIQYSWPSVTAYATLHRAPYTKHNHHNAYSSIAVKYLYACYAISMKCQNARCLFVTPSTGFITSRHYGKHSYTCCHIHIQTHIYNIYGIIRCVRIQNGKLATWKSNCLWVLLVF